jgi:hypothetical protein
MRFARLCLISFLLHCIGCQTASRNQVASIESPDGHLEAALYEINGGATTSFEYEVELRKEGERKGSQVASLYGAKRNENAYGANLKWNGNNELDIEYLSAKAPPKVRSTIEIDGRNIEVALKDGIKDPSAPSGGMLYNLNPK